MQATTPEVERAENEYDKQVSKLQRVLTYAAGGSAAEKAYSAAYQRLVTLGQRPQIKKKYR
jgi:hypothetical protein